MGFVICLLDAASALGLRNAGTHRRRNVIGIHDYLALCISRRTAYGLYQAGLTAQEALFICVQDRNHPDFGNIQPLAQKIDSHKHIKLAEAKVADDLHTLDRTDIVMHIAAANADVFQILCQILCHFLGQRGDKRALTFLNLFVDFADQIVDLSLNRPDQNLRIQQTGRANDLFHDLSGPFPFIFPWCGRNINPLMDPIRKLVKLQRPVIKSGGKAEAVFHQRLFPGPVAAIHGADLRQRHMALIHKEQKILREIIQQGHRRASRRAVGDHPGVVFNSRTIAQLLHHFNVIVRALANALSLEQFIVFFKITHTLIAFDPNAFDRRGHFFSRRHIMAGRIDRRMIQDPRRLPCDHVDLADSIHFIPKELDPDGAIIGIGRENLQRVAANPKLVALKSDVVALIANVDQLMQQLVKISCLTRAERNHHIGIVDRIAQAVNAGD